MTKFSEHLAKTWIHWVLAIVVFFSASLFYMGPAITNCSTTTTAFNSDSTGGFAWFQWVGGNDFSWEYSTKSNYPYGESVDRPQFITSALAISAYKGLSTLTTPICGINLMVLLGYMSTALLMFGLIRWLLGRTDIALLAGYAAAFVPYHLLKSQSHITYVYGAFFIAIVWAYLWFIKKPSYKRATLLALVGTSGFYFDGYFILISGVLIAGLFASSFLRDILRLIIDRLERQVILRNALMRLWYLAFSVLIMFFLLLPIFYTYQTQGDVIRQSLASARSNIWAETLLYGLRPIEFVLPSFNNPIMPDSYPAWRATKLHGSNFHEATLYTGYIILLLGLIALVALSVRKVRHSKISTIDYRYLIFIITFALLFSFILALPARVTMFDRTFPTPVAIFVEFTDKWRVLSRFFLSISPLLIILASLGLHIITKARRRITRLILVTFAGLILFVEYLPSPLAGTGDLYKDSPAVYSKLAQDLSVHVIAEYPLTDFGKSPSVFTYQQLHNKTLLNANDAGIIKGPLHASIAGLNDPQTLGALKKMEVDVVTTYGFDPKNSGLTTYYPNKRGASGVYSFTINNNVKEIDTLLTISEGYESLMVDDGQISHRAITGPATMKIFKIWRGTPSGKYNISFNAQAIVCSSTANLRISQEGRDLWSGAIGNSPAKINFTAIGDKPTQLTPSCSLDITHMSADKISD